MFGISETQKQRGDYIRELERASPAVTLFARVRFRLVMAAYPLLQWWFFGKPNRDSDRDSDSDSESESGSDSESESDSGSDSGSNSALMIQQENEEDKEGYTEVYQLLKHGTQCGVTLYVFDSVTRKDQFSDRIISDHYDKRAESINVLYLVSEVLTHRLSRKECEKLVMRHLEMMLRIAIKAVGQTGGDMAVWFSEVVVWCIRTARAFQAGTNDDLCRDACCGLLFETGLLRLCANKDTYPTYYVVNNTMNVLRHGATAVCALTLMCSGLPASQLLFHSARLQEWEVFTFVAFSQINLKSEVHLMLAKCGRQAGLCHGRVYRWIAANWTQSFSFAEWCHQRRRKRLMEQSGKEEVIDEQHVGCEFRCEHGRSIIAGHAGHMPWCGGCTESAIHVPEYDGSGILVFDTLKKELRNLRTEESYVAVSHVWGQRLFGQDTRTLGQCAFSELKRLATYKKVECVWLDTLCVPSEPVARRKCIDGMRSLYQDAACVAVYDKGIMAADATDILGFALEVSVSDWNSRVWTLQEGLLNKAVIFVQEHAYIPYKRRVLHPFFKWHAVAEAEGILMHIATGNIVKFQPHQVFGLAAGRTTSHDVDYVCGLGALLPKPITCIGADLTSAAVAMAQTWNAVDIGMLCTYSPRVNVEGYCWMPLGCKDMQPVDNVGVYGIVHDDGLHVEAEALYVGKLQRIEDTSPHLRSFQHRRDEHVYTNGSVIIATEADINLDGVYEFICGSGEVSFYARGFLVVHHDNGVYEYVIAANAKALDVEICCSKKLHIIGGPGECSDHRRTSGKSQLVTTDVTRSFNGSNAEPHAIFNDGIERVDKSH